MKMQKKRRSNKVKPKGRRAIREKDVIQSTVVGNNRVPIAVLDQLVHPNAAPLHEIPQDNEAESALQRVENLIFKGYYGTALREAKSLNFSHSKLKPYYEFIRDEKISRTNVRIADTYFIRGDKKNAKKFYEQAMALESTKNVISGVPNLAEQTFRRLLVQRQ